MVAFSSSAQTPDAPPSAGNSTCYSQQLVTLTLQNKDHLTDFINDLQTDADTFYVPAFMKAFQLIKETPVIEGKRGNSSILVKEKTRFSPSAKQKTQNRFVHFRGKFPGDAHAQTLRCTHFSVKDKVILMITDGAPQENTTLIYNTIRTANAQLNNSVVIFTYGIGESRNKTFQTFCCVKPCCSTN